VEVINLKENEASLKVDIFINDFCNGNDESIIFFYNNWYTEFYFIAYRYLKNKQDAEDAVSVLFEKLLKMSVSKRQQKIITQKVNIKAFLIVILKNYCLDCLKVKKNRKRIVSGIQHLWQKKEFNKVLTIISKEDVDNLLGDLPKRERLILQMRITGFSTKEIAEEFNLKPKTISNSLSKSRSILKDTLTL